MEIKKLNELAEKVEKPEDAADIIKQYEEIFCAKRKGIIAVAFHQGKVFKRFKEKEKFMQMVGKLKINKVIKYLKSTFFSLSKSILN